ncbi:3-isopropylmalate dehydratase large subunit [Mycobacterium shigaense]|uniref:(2R,3S)-2-methylisocitrate dehydratase n=1 Tax=Mycobacterium shigaense TaxID=722731 RepID=A0A1Z4EHW5_9MYCO|nr:3-isopropylmalate dehydratase large subunit [Mycobacterium shigaense]MEA1123772.1 3-isopropylmalate dehydratase large subunit [Mycobacterium shigaense]PRI12794.1 3-isopropylmalate dehydratase [Mycobacterium shigaense]BAX92551.1 3-isopropylmalate dehydratase large subunit [Mycobacterium shigaense]
MAPQPRTVFDKIWDAHVVSQLDADTALLYIDRVFLHEKSGAFALTSLHDDHRQVFDPHTVFGTIDHSVDTRPGRTDASPQPDGQKFIEGFRATAAEAGIPVFDLGDDRQGICHVTFPEQGLVLPGMTMVCSDSHTGTNGALGALAWGVGVSSCETALASQTLAVKRPKTLQARLTGSLADGVYAKDLILALIATIGAAGATGYAIEYTGPTVESLPIEGRMTLCNMAVEAAAFTGIVSPDAITLDYLKTRPQALTGNDWQRAARQWLALGTDDGARFDRTVDIDVTALAPQITWGTSPQHCVGIDASVPHPDTLPDSAGGAKALAYVGLTPGTPMTTVPIDAAFIGSCTNARLSDLQAAASLLAGRHVADGVTAICIPGSTAVKHAAEAEGIDRIFIDAGFQWRESGCGLCFFGGGEGFPTGARVISSTNRNFEGRQGPGVRTHLASPATVAASALTGHITDPRTLP